MLSRLQIRNYILIDSLDVSFPEGLIIITGQTGAGKSILLGALSLLTGARADASVISSGEDNCVVEAEFCGAGDHIKSLLDAADVEWDDGRLVIRRVVSRSGRSRSFINDSPVPVSLLQELSAHIVDIHSQHRSLLLTDRTFQLSVLDSFAGNSSLLKECSDAWDGMKNLESELTALRDKLSRLEAEEDYNRSRLERLNSANLRSGELQELEHEHRQLANAGQIKDSFMSALEALEPGDPSNSVSVAEALKEARKAIERIGPYVPEASSLASRLDSARLEVSDISDEIHSLDSRISLSEDRLSQVEQRMSLIYSLFTRYGCGSESELIELRDELSSALSDTSSLADRISDIGHELSTAKEVYDGICRQLRSSRAAAAPKFSESIESSLHFLELERAVFRVSLEEGVPSSNGCDKVQYLFSSNGRALQEISKCASGGELSRIMLSLKALMARFFGMPTMIFDEIDTGVSGSVADRMGRMICGMGRDMQVFSITHLPQVAAKGDAHYVVSKSEDSSGRMVTGMVEVTGQDRVLEIARLLSGSAITDAAMANAESLLKGC